MLVHQLLENSAEKYPERDAVYARGQWINYRDLNDKASRLAAALLKNGVQPGDRIAILWENSIEYVIAYYAILKAGGITVALNTEIVTADLSYLLDDSGAIAILLQNKFLKQLKEIDPSPAHLKLVICDGEPGEDNPGVTTGILEQCIEQEDPLVVDPGIIDLDTASIIYTSGSTGKPKGVVLSHLNILSNTRSIVAYLRLTENDRVMVVLPFFYVYGKSLLNTHVAVGGSLVIDNRFVFPNAVLDTMKKTACTGFAGVPSTFSILIHKSLARKQVFPSLRYLTQAGGPMTPALQKEVVEAFYPAELFIMYGATEASARLSYLDPRQLTRKWGSIGKAIPNVELYIADPEGHKLGVGEVGEIVARGANLTSGYWKDPQESAKVLKNGLYFTGDLGKMDDEGYIYVVGRSKDMIKSGANRISAKEIEEKISEHESVLEVAVVGVEDPTLGEAIKACVVKKQGHVDFSAEALVSFCKTVLPPFKVPKYIEFLDALPKSAAGKIQKLELKKMYGELTK